MSYQDDGGRAKDVMTLRDYFAAKALQGLLANPDVDLDDDQTFEVFQEEVSGGCYGWADAMLESRK